MLLVCMDFYIYLYFQHKIFFSFLADGVALRATETSFRQDVEIIVLLAIMVPKVRPLLGSLVFSCVNIEHQKRRKNC